MKRPWLQAAGTPQKFFHQYSHLVELNMLKSEVGYNGVHRIFDSTGHWQVWQGMMITMVLASLSTCRTLHSCPWPPARWRRHRQIAPQNLGNSHSFCQTKKSWQHSAKTDSGRKPLRSLSWPLQNHLQILPSLFLPSKRRRGGSFWHSFYPCHRSDIPQSIEPSQTFLLQIWLWIWKSE